MYTVKMKIRNISKVEEEYMEHIKQQKTGLIC